MNDWQRYYRPPQQSQWLGRIDQPSHNERIHQWLIAQHAEQLSKAQGATIALIGFACDEGVRRNHGRVGAALGPQAIRKALANLCLSRQEAPALLDLGDIVCHDGQLEAAQAALAYLVDKALSYGIRPLVLGGGHETAWGHFQGLIPSLAPIKSLAIVNFDAHFDLRPLPAANKGSSGTPFMQMAQHCQQHQLDFDYTCFGIQKTANTQSLFQKAQELGVNHLLAEDLMLDSAQSGLQMAQQILARCKQVYITLCLDVFSASIAPGVSASQAMGIMPWHILPILRLLLSSGKTIAFDVVELAPPFDQDERTAKLAAYFVTEVLRAWSS